MKKLIVLFTILSCACALVSAQEKESESVPENTQENILPLTEPTYSGTEVPEPVMIEISDNDTPPVSETENTVDKSAQMGYDNDAAKRSEEGDILNGKKDI